MKGLEEENKLQVDRDLLQVRPNRGDGDKLGDVEDKGETQHRHEVTDHCLLQVRCSLLRYYHLILGELVFSKSL